MVTLILAVIVLSIAIPAFTHLIVSDRLSATTGSFVGAMNQARLVAIKRNHDTQLCSNSNNNTDTLGTACGSQLGAVYALDSDGKTTTRIRNGLTLPSDIKVGSGAVALRYGGEGLASDANNLAGGPYTGLVADFYTHRISTDNHRCIYITAGSAVDSCTITPSGTGGCPNLEPKTCQP